MIAKNSAVCHFSEGPKFRSRWFDAKQDIYDDLYECAYPFHREKKKNERAPETANSDEWKGNAPPPKPEEGRWEFSDKSGRSGQTFHDLRPDQPRQHHVVTRADGAGILVSAVDKGHHVAAQIGETHHLIDKAGLGAIVGTG